MYARVATWEGGTPDGIRAASEEMKSNVAQGPPEGVKSSGLTMLADADGGRIMMIGLYASEADLSDSEAALSAMTPPEGFGQRTSVEVFEVEADVRM